MDNAKWDLSSFEAIDKEIRSIVGPGVRADLRHRAAELLGKMSEIFESAQGKTKPGGFSSFNEWARDVTKTREFARGQIYGYAAVGRYLLPRVTKSELEKLRIAKAITLARVAKAGRLSDEFLKASFGFLVRELEQRAAPLLGRDAPWRARLRIDTHEAALAALLMLGNWLDYETYTAHPGRKYEDQKLAEIVTLKRFPHFPTEGIEKSAKRIDVIWVKEDWPEFFFEVENTTNVTGGLHRMYQVSKLDAKFFIVARPDVQARFDREIEKPPFKDCRDKYRFRSYSELARMFQAGKTYDSFFK
jgi:hypothetical protein